jgi:hypothetical protein
VLLVVRSTRTRRRGEDPAWMVLLVAGRQAGRQAEACSRAGPGVDRRLATEEREATVFS